MPGPDDLWESLRDRVFSRDRAGAVRVALDAVAAGDTSIATLYGQLSELMVGVGASWQTGDVEVWQEHHATAIVRTIVEACAPLVAEQAPDPVGYTVVLATPPEEHHDLGLRMLADFFTLAGWTVHLLGASVPVAELADAVGELQADAAVLSVSTHFQRTQLRGYLDRLRSARPRLRIWVTGAAFANERGAWSDDEVLDPSAVPAAAGKL